MASNKQIQDAINACVAQTQLFAQAQTGIGFIGTGITSNNIISNTTSITGSTATTLNSYSYKKEETTVKSNSILDRVETAGKTVVDKQAVMAKTALTLEAARILNNQLVAIASKKLPLMVRGYADTAIGKAVIANAFFMGMEMALPNVGDNDVRKQVARAAVVGAYQEFVQSFDVEGVFNDLFTTPALKKMTDRLSAED